MDNQGRCHWCGELMNSHLALIYDPNDKQALADFHGIPMLADDEAMRAIATLRARGHSPVDVQKAMERTATAPSTQMPCPQGGEIVDYVTRLCSCGECGVGGAS